MINLRDVSKKYDEKLKKIKVALFDCDGILTDGKVFYQGSEMGFNRFFHVADGYGMRLLMRSGIEVGVISGGDSLGVHKRLDLLGVTLKYLGNENKKQAYLEIKEKTGASDDEILYMGDDLFDIPLLNVVGFSATVNHASLEVQEACDYVCQKAGGLGAAREVIDLIRYSQGIFPELEAI